MPLSMFTRWEKKLWNFNKKKAYIIMKLSDDKLFINKKSIVKTHTYIKELLPVTEPLYVI